MMRKNYATMSVTTAFHPSLFFRLYVHSFRLSCFHAIDNLLGFSHTLFCMRFSRYLYLCIIVASPLSFCLSYRLAVFVYVFLPFQSFNVCKYSPPSARYFCFLYSIRLKLVSYFCLQQPLPFSSFVTHISSYLLKLKGCWTCEYNNEKIVSNSEAAECF